ncbi:MAG: hypothetical protein AB7D36_05545 [Oscillospiraceae bacterium]
MTITNRIKSELFNADMDYYFALDQFKAEFPHGVNFCYDTVSSKAATMYATLERAEGRVTSLSYLISAKLKGEKLEAECRRLIDKYNNAETSEDAEAAEKEYYNLYTIMND